MLRTYLNENQVDTVYASFLFSFEAHQGQTRRTGEPYIIHPLAVAMILAEMRMDHQSIIAAILHDIIEDTRHGKDDIARYYGEDVAQLVDGVSKLTQFESSSPAEAQAANYRKMIMAMTQDIRVILVKLADRLHNMRTLSVMPADKKRRIARETLEIYAPIANRLGMNAIRLELQDLGFFSLHPMRYRILSEAVRKARGNRKEVVQTIETAITERLNQDGIHGEVGGREKHLYSIYEKMRTKKLSFSEVFDVYAFRVIVDNVDYCYRVLGVVHNLYKPVPGKFKDYIAIPKANGYQSLHTVLYGPFGAPIEVQIRSADMDKVAERGIAAHWLYKTDDASIKNSAQSRARDWMRELLEMQKNAGNSMEFIENVKVDLFPDSVYVFTPKGDIFELPQGSTPVDFAYAVHTDVGDRCVAAKIDRHLTPLRSRLFSGQTVEIITAPGARPNPAWLNFVVTGKARTHIRHFLKNLQAKESVQLGRRLLDQSLSHFGISVTKLPVQHIEHVLLELKLPNLDHLLGDIGLGNRMAPLIARHVVAVGGESYVTGDHQGPTDHQSLVIKGTEGMVVNFAKCCRPIPGDAIVGFFSAGKGIVIHSQNCKNVMDFRERPERWIEVEWEEGVERDFPVNIRVEALNKRGVLASIAASIADMGANIEYVNIDEKDGRYSSMRFTLDVKNRGHLADIIRRLRASGMIIKIARIR